jgi:hypothetical protein
MKTGGGGAPVADGRAVLEAQIRRLNELPGMVREAVPEVRDEVRAELLAQADRGETPEGTPWKPTQSGGKALRNASKHLEVTARGTVVIATLTGHYARHDLGAVKGKVKRKIMPSARMPQPVAEAIRKVYERRFRERMGGA